MRTFAAGRTMFVGGAIARRLPESTHRVRGPVRPGADTRQLTGRQIEQVDRASRDLDSQRRG